MIIDDTIFDYYGNAVFCNADAAIRECLSGSSHQKLSAYLSGISHDIKTDMFATKINQISYDSLLGGAFNVLSAVLMYRNDKEGLQMMEEFSENSMFGDDSYYWSFDIFTNSKLNLLHMITLFSLKEPESELCKRLIDRWIDIDYRERKRIAARNQNKIYGDFINHPLYPLMIAEKYRLVRYFIERYTERLTDMENDPFGGMRLPGYVESAIHFRQKEFLQLLYDYNYPLIDDTEALAYIYSDNDNIEFLSEIWDVRKEIIPREEFYNTDDRNAPKRKSICIIREKQLKLLYKLYNHYGVKPCDELFSDIPLINTINEQDLLDILPTPYYDYDFIISPAVLQPEPEDSDDLNNPEKLIDRYTAQNITILVGEGNILNFSSSLFGKNLTYDFRDGTINHSYMSIGSQNIRWIISFLKSAKIIFNNDEFTALHVQLVQRNSAPLMRTLIQKGAFSERNYGDAVNYMVEQKLYNCLSELTKSFLKEEI